MKIKYLKELISASNRIYRYRKDLLSSSDLGKLSAVTEKLKTIIKHNKNNKLTTSTKHEVNKIDEFLKKIGGKIYPKTFMIDNIEVGLVALIVVIGIRSFFFQPFIIPTNSMYPTYSGMRHEIYGLEDSPLSFKEKVFNKLIFGSTHYNLISDRSGEVSFELFSPNEINTKPGIVKFEYIKGKKWFLFPTILKEYTLYVDKSEVKIKVPRDFNFDKVIFEALVLNNDKFDSEKFSWNQFFSSFYTNDFGQYSSKKSFHNPIRISTGNYVNEGDRILSFDIKSGDALFVDRFSYNFIKPRVGDPFVFRTSLINLSDLGDMYYIKRLAGDGGELLSINNSGQLLSNGLLRNEVSAFRSNNEKSGEYRGYQNTGLIINGYKVEDGNYFAMGDNSYNSKDSRSFGQFPKNAVIGKAFFIYFPFTDRWGKAN